MWPNGIPIRLPCIIKLMQSDQGQLMRLNCKATAAHRGCKLCLAAVGHPREELTAQAPAGPKPLRQQLTWRPSHMPSFRYIWPKRAQSLAVA